MHSCYSLSDTDSSLTLCWNAFAIQFLRHPARHPAVCLVLLSREGSKAVKSGFMAQSTQILSGTHARSSVSFLTWIQAVPLLRTLPLNALKPAVWSPRIQIPAPTKMLSESSALPEIPPNYRTKRMLFRSSPTHVISRATWRWLIIEDLELKVTEAPTVAYQEEQ